MVSRAAFLQSLVDPVAMHWRLRLMSMYDAIVAPDSRSFEFHPKWRKGEQMGAFKDGEGNFVFAWFSRRGCVVRGFDHDSVVSPFRHDPPREWPGLFQGLPPSLHYATTEPAFALDEVTFALWRTFDAKKWSTGNVKLPRASDPDGMHELLACFDRNCERWRARYYGTPKSAAFSVLWWEREAITREVVAALNPDADLAAVREEAKLLSWKTEGLEGASMKKTAKVKAAATGAATGATKAARKVHKARKSFGEAQFVVHCEPTRVRMLIHGDTVVAEAKVDVYEELFDLVKARLVLAKKTGT